jgi:hypothetical protein
MLASISADKVSSEECEHDGPSYRSFVSSMCKRNPNLVKLEEILTRHGPPFEDGRAAVIEIYDTHVSEHRMNTSNELLEYMNRQDRDSTSSCHRRLYLLEGLPANYIEILGHRLRIDPDFFDRQINCGYLKTFEDVRDIPLLYSHPTSQESFTLRYHELRNFGDARLSHELSCVNQPRRISVTQSHGKFDGVGSVRRKASFWSRMKGEKAWDGMT